MHGKVASAVAVALMAATVGCGGSGDDPLTKAQLVKQAGAICEHRNGQNVALYKAAVKSAKKEHLSTRAMALKVVPEASANQRQAIKELEDLKPPEALEDRFSQWRVALRASNAMGIGPLIENEVDHAKRRALELRLERLVHAVGLPPSCL